ncbi:MAG: DNA-binding protein [Lachnospiraceae bacterium]|nr:DNA-binding protein [Lachnospiraceae bacterium]MBQ9642656.1 DNA-binding protein [Lachnospiraceae bacterium]
MTKYEGFEFGKVIILNLKRGDLLLETIEEELAKSGIKNALLTSAIGSMQKVVLHRVIGTGREPEDEYITLENPMELASLQGFVLDGKAHFHMVVSDVHEAYTGHLEPGTTVLYLCEISLVELKGVSLCREKNEDNIGMIVEKKD